MATADRPIIRAAEMGRTEAEQVTQAIKDNFDSLGAMLAMARDRKAYKALGYRSFESYCQSEFGKSISSAYQLIEDAKVLSQLEARISQEYGEDITLNFPSSHLKPLKEIDNIDDKLKAIEYANKLAAAENRKATKKDLEIAVFQISGKRSEDFRAAIQGLGFNRGVQIEVIKSLRRDRGCVTKIDKAGKIHVQLNSGGANSIPFDAADLRILTDAEKPATPLNEITASKGDRVLIFAQGLEGKKGTIYTWKDGKQALVLVDGENNPVNIAYLELQLIRDEQKDTNWDSELVWNTEKNTYYYFPQEDTIYSNKWPAGLTLTPHSHELSPINFMANWENKFAGELLEALATPAIIKTSVLAQAIELPEEKGKEFAGDLIDSLLQLFPQTVAEFPSVLTQLIDKNQRLQEQLTEAETAIQSMVAAFAPSTTASALEPLESIEFLLENTSDNPAPGETAAHSDFLVENTAEISSPGDTAVYCDSWKQLLENNGFTLVPYELEGFFKGHWRGWNLFFHSPNGGVTAIDIANEKEAMFTRCTEVDFDIDLDNEEAIINWVRGVVNQVEDFCPGQLSLFSIPIPTVHEVEVEKGLPTEILERIEIERNKAIESKQDINAVILTKRASIDKELEQATQELLRTKDEKKTKKIRTNIRILESRLEDVEKFVAFRVGDLVIRNIFPDRKGIVDRLEISTTGMLTAWVIWPQEYEAQPNSPEEHNIGTLTNLSSVDSGKK